MVYFDGVLYRALQMKATELGLSVSDLVNRAVGAALAEDAEDVQAHRARAGEPNVDFADLVVSLKSRGKI